MAYQFGQRSLADLQRIVTATERLRAAVAGPALANGAGRLATIIRDDAISICPVSTVSAPGHVHLRDTIGVRRYAAGPSRAVYGIGTDDPRGPLVEFGTAPHVIEPRTKQALWWAGAAHPVGRVLHPGSRPHPWLELALAQPDGLVAQQFADALREATAAGGPVASAAGIATTFTPGRGA